MGIHNLHCPLTLNASTNTSRLEAHTGFFKLLMKGKLEECILGKSWFLNYKHALILKTLRIYFPPFKLDPALK